MPLAPFGRKVEPYLAQFYPLNGPNCVGYMSTGRRRRNTKSFKVSESAAVQLTFRSPIALFGWPLSTASDALSVWRAASR